MPLRKPTNFNPSPSTRFSKTNPPKNPGRKPMTQEEKDLKKMTIETYSALVQEMMNASKHELKRMYRMEGEHKDINGVKALIARAIYWGDTAELEKLLARVIGSVPQKTELSGPGGTPLVPSSIVVQPVKSLTELKKDAK